MGLNKLCKVSVALYLAVLLCSWLTIPATLVQLAPQETLCTRIRNHISCVHCFREKVKRSPLPLSYIIPQTPYSFLASLASCKQFTCEDMLQAIDNDKEDLSIEITKEVNDYLNALETTIVRAEGTKTPLGIRDHAWILFTRQLENTPYIVYKSAELGMYEAIAQTVLLFLSLLILVWDSRKKNQGSPAQQTSRSSPIFILACIFFVELIPLLPIQNSWRFWGHLAGFYLCYVVVLYKALAYIEGAQSAATWLTSILIVLIENAKLDHRSLGYSRMLCFGLFVPICIIIYKIFLINREKTHQQLASSIGSCLLLLALFAVKITDEDSWNLGILTLMNCVPVLLTINLSEEGFSKIQEEGAEEEEAERTLG